METKAEKSLSPLFRYVGDFLVYCEIEKNQSQRTIENYDHYLRRFALFAEQLGVKKPEGITMDLVRSYRLHLNRMVDHAGRTLKIVTQSYHIIALRAFLKYLIKRNVATLAPEKIELAKNPSREVSVLEDDEIFRLFAATDSESNELLRLRDKAILLTLFSTGVRIS
jgi:site-specific recombinase XerD